jgi:hypothetical protein
MRVALQRRVSQSLDCALVIGFVVIMVDGRSIVAASSTPGRMQIPTFTRE